MKIITATVVISCLILFFGCANPEKKWGEATKTNTVLAYESYLNEFPDGPHLEDAKTVIAKIKLQEAKAAIVEAITVFIKNEKGFKSMEDISLLQAEEISLTNRDSLKTKKNYKVWKALAKATHVCDGCPIQELENNTALFIITEDESKHFEAFLHTISLKGMDFMRLLMSKAFTEEVETANRYSHTRGAELNDGNSYIWTTEEYSYPTNLRPTKFPISETDNIKIDQTLNILDIKGDGIQVIWNTKSRQLIINDVIARRKVTLKKGDSPVTFDEYYTSTEGRRIKFVVE